MRRCLFFWDLWFSFGFTLKPKTSVFKKRHTDTTLHLLGLLLPEEKFDVCTFHKTITSNGLGGAFGVHDLIALSFPELG